MEKLNGVAVVGAGMMGAEIGLSFALQDSRVLLKDIRLDLAEAGKGRIGKILARWVEKGKISPDASGKIMERVCPQGDYSGFEAVDLVIEAVLEETELKGQIYRQLEEVCRHDCIIASNTSTIPITKLAAYTKKPDRFIGMHFFSPASIMKLVEVIPGMETGEDTVQKAIETVRAIGKEPIRVRDCAGFLVNRLLFAFFNEAWRIVDEGAATPEDVDKAVKFGLNHPIGIFQSQDLVGLDLALTNTLILQDEYGERYRPAPVLKRKVDAGHLGRKTKRGWFNYEK